MYFNPRRATLIEVLQDREQCGHKLVTVVHNDDGSLKCLSQIDLADRLNLSAFYKMGIFKIVLFD